MRKDNFGAFIEVCEEKGWKDVAHRKVSKHEDDWYLAYVVIENQKGEFVTYLFNAEDRAFYSGHYFHSLDAAIEDLHLR